MKTARSIEEQEARKVDEKEANSSRFSRENTPPVMPKAKQRDATRIAAWRWQPEHCPNPGGRAVFEQDNQAIFNAFRKLPRKGSPYGFQVLADRAFGKMKETIAHEHSPYEGVSDEDLEKRIAEPKAKLGWPDESKAQQSADDPKVQ